MGCDIHDYVEIQVNGKWQKVGEVFDNYYYRPEEKDIWKQKVDHPLDVRNYDAFAVLAGVRNGRGFAGAKTGNGFRVIANPKGLPADVTHAVQKEADDWGPDGHSHSWVSLAELEAVNWELFSDQQGWVNPEEYKIFKEKGQPRSWSGGVSGGRVKHVLNEEMDRLIDKGTATEWHYTLVKWREPYRDCVGRLHSYTIPALQNLAKEHNLNSEQIRMVFWFDN